MSKEQKQAGSVTTLADFSEAVANESVSQKHALEVLKKYFQAVKDTITSGQMTPGDKIDMPGVGRLTVVKKNARTTRNPHTGEKMQLPERVGIKFKLSGALRTFGKPPKGAKAEKPAKIAKTAEAPKAAKPAAPVAAEAPKVKKLKEGKVK